MPATMLIASPLMKDPFFERTVVLVWRYDEEGAIGVVINRALDHTLPEVLDVDDDVDLSDYHDVPVVWGGPVERAAGTVVTAAEVGEGEGQAIEQGVSVTHSPDALMRLLRRGDPLMLCLGYAGWGSGQLDREIEEGGWLLSEVDPEILFKAPIEQRWETALASLGLDEHTLLMRPIVE